MSNKQNDEYNETVKEAKEEITSSEAGKLSVKKRFKGKTKEEISEMMKKVSLARLKRKN